MSDEALQRAIYGQGTVDSGGNMRETQLHDVYPQPYPRSQLCWRFAT